MNQGKLEVIKQEMARVNIDILGISTHIFAALSATLTETSRSLEAFIFSRDPLVHHALCVSHQLGCSCNVISSAAVPDPRPPSYQQIGVGG